MLRGVSYVDDRPSAEYYEWFSQRHPGEWVRHDLLADVYDPPGVQSAVRCEPHIGRGQQGGTGELISYHPAVEELLACAQAMQGELIGRREETEKLTHYPDRTHQDFLDAGFYRMLVPRRYGGLECDLPAYSRIIMALARGCPSSAWALALGAGHALQAGSWLPKEAQDEVFGTEYVCIASFTMPVGVASRVDGGWEIDGTWPCSSGAPHATFYMGHTLAPPQREGEEPGPPMLFFAPKGSWTMLDDWGDTLGLGGTGSNSVRFEHAVLPDHLVVPETMLLSVGGAGDSEGYRLHGNPMYTGRSKGFFGMEIASVAVGIAKAALDEYDVLLRSRRTTMPPITLRSDDPDYQRWFGTAVSRTAVAEAAVVHSAQRYMELCRRSVQDGVEFSAADDLLLISMNHEAVQLCWDVVQAIVFRTAGSSETKGGKRLRQLFGDMAMIWSHAFSVRTDFSARELTQAHIAETPTKR